MHKPGVVIDPRYLDHDTGRGHPERPERIGVLIDQLQRSDDEYSSVPARLADAEELALAHDSAHVERVAATASQASYAFDPDTPVGPRSYDTARLATGGLLALLDAVIAGEVRNGFALVRPPGHHAERERAMGFCLFNSVAVGAQYLRRRYGLERVLIVDWDLHHGNGTQQIFEHDPGVLFISTHQYPFYPGSGALDECGRGEGEGFTVNLPLPAGCADGEYVDAFDRVVLPIAAQFRPQFVLISAGFDAHAADPLGGMRVSADGFRALARRLVGLADEQCGGRCAAVLEGGYDLEAIRASTRAVLDELAGRSAALPTFAASRIDPLLARIVAQQSEFWKL